MSDYSIRKLESNEFDLLLPLMEDCFGMSVDVQYFRWKFLDNPAGHFIGFIAVHKETDEVAAYYGVIPQWFLIRGEKARIFQSCDTMTHSRHRRKGLFQQLALTCYDYLRENETLFVIGFSGRQSTPGFLKFGWKLPFYFRNCFIPKPLCYPAMIRNSASGALRNVSDLSDLGHLIPRDESAEIFSIRDLEQFRWRYGNPRRTLVVTAFQPESEPEGYISRFTKDNKLFLFDFAFRTERSRKALTTLLKQETVKIGYSGVIAFCQENHHTELALRKSGFITNPFSKGPLSEKTPFIFYSDPQTMDRFSKADSWSLTSYDHDAS